METVIPRPETSLLVLVDMQEKLLRAMSDPGSCMDGCLLMLRSAAALSLPVLATEQYPKGLGNTVPELVSALPSGSPVIEKSAFSCFGEPAFAEAAAVRSPETMILCGIESHVCVAQTALDAAEKGLRVFVVRNAVTSRRVSDRESVFPFLQANGVQVVSAETLLFLLMRTSRHPSFKEISRLIR